MFSNFIVELGTTNSEEKFTVKTHEPRLRNLEQRLPVILLTKHQHQLWSISNVVRSLIWQDDNGYYFKLNTVL